MSGADLTVFIFQQALLRAIPLLIVALGGVFSERSGIINLALDGERIFGAFIGAVFVKLRVEKAAWAGTSQALFLLGRLISAAAGAIRSLLLSFAAIKRKADQTIVGTSLNGICSISSIACKYCFSSINSRICPQRTLLSYLPIYFILLNILLLL